MGVHQILREGAPAIPEDIVVRSRYSCGGRFTATEQLTVTPTATKGVMLQSDGKYRVRITVGRNIISVGEFDDYQEAVNAHHEARRQADAAEDMAVDSVTRWPINQ
jgi:hypothetical protein